MTFEEYIQNKHANQYEGLDDEMPDNYDEWLAEISPDEWIEYADEWHKSLMPKPIHREGMKFNWSMFWFGAFLAQLFFNWFTN